MIKSCLVGTHSTGKSTLLEALRKETLIQVRDQTPPETLELISSPTRMLREKGFKINDDAKNYDQTQLLCATYDVQNFYLKKSFISDRGAIDTLIYTKYLFEEKKVSERVYRFVEMLGQEVITGYTHIFYLESEIPLVGDSVRSTDTKFREKIDMMFQDKFLFWNRNFMPIFERVYSIHGTIEERVVQIKEYLMR